jgi:hypothetical protein
MQQTKESGHYGVREQTPTGDHVSRAARPDDVFLRLAQNAPVYLLNQQNGIINPPAERYNRP